MRAAHLTTVIGAVLLAAGCLWFFAPGYWLDVGFPLDDSWIHAVYGRELARSGLFAYNPGIAAAGETAPLWAILFALPHLLTQDPRIIVLSMKIIGLALHGVTAVLALRLASHLTASPVVAIASAALVALHPDLIAASVSGMELPLATALALWVSLEVLRGPSWRLALACFLAPLGRPEIACIAFLVLAIRAIAGRRDALARLALTILGGTLAAFALIALQNGLVTGRPLPSTFYAKVGTRGLSPWFIQWFGFRHLLEHFALVNSLFLLVPLALLALWLLCDPRQRAAAAPPSPAAPALGGGLFLAGLAFFSISFALVVPTGDDAFYFQRYSLPGLPLVLVDLPPLIDRAIGFAPASRVALLRGAVAIALAIGLLAPMPGRLWRLANDARNIDDVQVAEGRALAEASPHHVVWAVDAGAIRYFGRAFVVDTVGLNTPEMLTPMREAYLDRHPPHYVSLVSFWAELDPSSAQLMTRTVFEPTTRYTVTAFLPQAVHTLARCPSEALEGAYIFFRRPTPFRCGRW